MTCDSEAPPPPAPRFAWLFKARNIRWLVFLTIVAILVVIVIFRHQLTDVQHLVKTLGYPGIFLASLAGAASIGLPIPGVAATFLGGALLNPVLVGMAAGAGESLGEFVGYGLGYSGSGFAQKNRLYPRFERWVVRWGWLPVFILALIPNPFFDLIGIAAGALRLPLWRFFLANLVGKTLKNIGIAYAGWLGADWVRGWLG